MSPNEKASSSFGNSVFGKEEVLQLLGEMLAQVKPGFHHQQPPLSQAAKAAIAAYRSNLETLGTDTGGTGSSSTT